MSNNNKISNGACGIPLAALIIGILPIAASLLGAFILRSLYAGASHQAAWKIFAACELALVAAGLALLAVAALKSRKSNTLLTATTLVAIAALLCYIPIEALLKNGLTAAVFIFCGVITAVAAAVFLIVNRAKTARMRVLPVVAFASLVVEAAVGTTLRAGVGAAYAIPAVSVLYLLFAMFCMKKYADAQGSKSLLAALLIGWGMLVVPGHLYGLYIAIVDLPAILPYAVLPYAATLCSLLGMLAGFAWYRARARWVGWSVFCAMLALAVFMLVKGYALWLELWG